MARRIGKEKAPIEREIEDRLQNIQLVNENVGRRDHPVLFDPAVAVLVSDIADGCILKIRNQSIDVHFPALDRAGTEGVFIGFQLHFPCLGKSHFGA
jgi:regulator of extracellular matrix RemA (YlzA/DUF370 family)